MTENDLVHILEELIKLPAETEVVEFKHAENSFADSDLGEYFSALSNEANLKGKEVAWLVFGIENKTHRTLGTNYKPTRPSLDAMKKKIADQMTNRITFDEIYELQHDGKRVIMFQIPAAPQGLPVAYQGHYYGRDNESLGALNLHEIELIRSQAKGIHCFELQPAKDGLTNADVLELLDYRKVYEQIGKRVPSSEIDILNLLREYDFVQGTDGLLTISNMGALLYARRLSDFKNLRLRGLVVRKYEGNSNLVMNSERHSVSGYLVEFDDLLDYIFNSTSIERIVGKREQVATYPKVAIREFLANQMVHQDFNISGMPLTVEIFRNRLTFTNPGSSLNDVNRLIDLPPHSRNERLAQMMLTFDICERRGSGYDRAVAAIEEMLLPAYKTESGQDYTRVTLYPQKKLSDMTKNERIQACYQHVCLLYERQEVVGNVSVRERFGLNKNQSGIVSHILKDTVEAGLIRIEDPMSDSKRYASYVPFYA